MGGGPLYSLPVGQSVSQSMNHRTQFLVVSCRVLSCLVVFDGWMLGALLRVFLHITILRGLLVGRQARAIPSTAQHQPSQLLGSSRQPVRLLRLSLYLSIYRLVDQPEKTCSRVDGLVTA
jgi:hypothetical protein